MPLDPEKLAALYGDIVVGVEVVGFGTARKTRMLLRIVDSRLSGSPEEAVLQVMEFARAKLKGG